MGRRPYIFNSGDIFGYLQIIEKDEEKSKITHQTHYKCKCLRCGKEISTSASNLLRGQKSCGCLNRELASKRCTERNRKTNELLLYPELGYGIGFFNNAPNEFFIFDIEDLDVVQGKCWYKDPSNGYVRHNSTYVANIGEKRLHRAIMAKYFDITGKEIVHINHNKSDNRKCNLRICTPSENCRNRNRNIASSGYRNIRKRSDYNSYQFNTTINGVKYTKCSKDLNELIEYRDKFLSQHNVDQFSYNKNNDIRYNPDGSINPFKIEDNPNVITPFVFINN